MLGGMRRPRLTSSAIVAILLGACSATPIVAEPSSTVATSASTKPATPTASPSRSMPPTPQPEPLAWQRLGTDGPAAREDHTWTVDGAGELAYLFGGRDGATVFDDTWAYDLDADTWTRLAPPSAPPARFGHDAVWVDDIGLVVFAGQAGQAFFSDLWAYDPASDAWAELPAAGAIPVPRYGTCAGIGPDGRLWISHGFTEEQTRFFDTRAYDFASGSWTDETPVDGPRPVERCLHGCWWTDGGDLNLYAGQTTGVTALDDRWILREGAWSQVEGDLPPARNLYARGRVDGGTIVFGGQALDGSYLADLWLLGDEAIDAEGLDPAGDPPPGRAGAELVVDSAGGRALLFGGRGADGALDDLWVLGGL